MNVNNYLNAINSIPDNINSLALSLPFNGELQKASVAPAGPQANQTLQRVAANIVNLVQYAYFVMQLPSWQQLDMYRNTLAKISTEATVINDRLPNEKISFKAFKALDQLTEHLKKTHKYLEECKTVPGWSNLYKLTLDGDSAKTKETIVTLGKVRDSLAAQYHEQRIIKAIESNLIDPPISETVSPEPLINSELADLSVIDQDDRSSELENVSFSTHAESSNALLVSYSNNDPVNSREGLVPFDRRQDVIQFMKKLKVEVIENREVVGAVGEETFKVKGAEDDLLGDAKYTTEPKCFVREIDNIPGVFLNGKWIKNTEFGKPEATKIFSYELVSSLKAFLKEKGAWRIMLVAHQGILAQPFGEQAAKVYSNLIPADQMGWYPLGRDETSETPLDWMMSFNLGKDNFTLTIKGPYRFVNMENENEMFYFVVKRMIQVPIEELKSPTGDEDPVPSLKVTDFFSQPFREGERAFQDFYKAF